MQQIDGDVATMTATGMIGLDVYLPANSNRPPATRHGSHSKSTLLLKSGRCEAAG